MKKIIITGLFFLVTTVSIGQASNFYQLQLKDVAGNQISMASYNGKKVVVGVCSAALPDLQWLLSLDSLQRKNASSIKVLIIPVRDFDALGLVADLQHLLLDSLQLNMVVCSACYAKKTAGAAQQNLSKWLTYASGNTHFDYDIASLRQLFVVSEKGRLFGVTQGDHDLFLYLDEILKAQVPDN